VQAHSKGKRTFTTFFVRFNCIHFYKTLVVVFYFNSDFFCFSGLK